MHNELRCSMRCWKFDARNCEDQTFKLSQVEVGDQGAECCHMAERIIFPNMSKGRCPTRFLWPWSPTSKAYQPTSSLLCYRHTPKCWKAHVLGISYYLSTTNTRSTHEPNRLQTTSIYSLSSWQLQGCYPLRFLIRNHNSPCHFRSLLSQ